MTTVSPVWTFGVVAALAWGAAAFGGVYPWGYIPLLIAAAMLGGAGLIAGRARVPRSLFVAFVLVAAAVLVQLLPLSADTIADISPHTLRIYRERDLSAAIGTQQSFTLSIDPQRTWLALAFFGSFALLTAGSARMLTRESARRLAIGLTILGAVMAIGGIVQRAAFNGQVYGVWPLVQGGTPFGPFINRNHFAGWMLLVLPLSIGLLASMVSRAMPGAIADLRSRVLWFATDAANKVILTAFVVAAMTLALTLTLSRSGIASLAMAMVFASAAMMRRRGGVRRFVTPAVMLTVAAIAFAAVGVDRIASRFAVAGSIDMEGRRAIWLDASRMLNDFWFTGSGLNTFGVAALFYQVRLKGSHMQEAHNDYLQLAAEGGLMVGLPIAIAIAAAIIAIRRRLRADEGSIWWIRIGAVSGLLAIAAQSLVEFSLQIPANAALFAVVLGIALHDGARTTSGRSRKPGTAPHTGAVDRDDKVVRFGDDQRFDFPVDSRTSPIAAADAEFDVSDLDDDTSPLVAPRVVHTPARPRTNRHVTSQDGRSFVLIAALALGLLVLLLLSLLRG